MTEEDILETIQKIITQVTGKQIIGYETDFIQDLELNSFEVINLICAFEEYYDLTVPTRDIWQMHQVKDVIEYIKDMGMSS